jgi:hypothetical protein
MVGQEETPTMAEGRTLGRRVLVALDPCAVDPADFEASARLAAGLKAELVALFVEDSSLIAAAGLPFARLIPSGCRELAALDAAAMRRAIRVAEGEARAQLSSAAQRWRLQWSFEVTEVRRAAEAMARLGSEDFLTLSGASGRQAVVSRRTAAVRAERAPCPVMVLRGEARRGQPVSVLYEGGPSTLALGRDLARVYESPLLVLAAGEDEALRAEREAEVARWLAESETAGVAQQITADDTAGIGRLLDEVDAGLVVVDRRAAVGGRLDLDALAARTRASIVILGIG